MPCPPRTRRRGVPRLGRLRHARARAASGGPAAVPRCPGTPPPGRDRPVARRGPADAQPRRATGHRLQRHDLQLPPAARRARERWAGNSAPNPTPRCFWRPSPTGGRTAFAGWWACSRWACWTRDGESFFLPATSSGSSRSITRTGRGAWPSHRRSRHCWNCRTCLAARTPGASSSSCVLATAIAVRTPLSNPSASFRPRTV